MKRKNKSADVQVNYEEIETVSELAQSELSAAVGGATSATDGLSHLMKKASAEQVQTQENFLMQHVEQTIGGNHYEGQSEEPIVQSAVSHLDEELSSKGEVLTEKGMETFVHNLDSQINSSFGTQVESGRSADIGKEWTKFTEDYATATGGVAEQEAQVRSIEKSMDALVAGQPDAKELEGAVHGYAQTLLSTLESNGEVLTQTGLEHSLENSSMSNLAGQISWSNIVAETSVQEVQNHQTVADIEKSVYSDLQSVADNWQASQLSAIAGLNQQTINSEVQQAIHQFEADGHVLSQKEAQSIISSVESQDGITFASHVESVTNQVISDYQTASPLMQDSHMTYGGVEDAVRAAYGQAGAANNRADASVTSSVEQALGIVAADAAAGRSVASNITSDSLNVIDPQHSNLQNYVQAMESTVSKEFASPSFSDADRQVASQAIANYAKVFTKDIEAMSANEPSGGNNPPAGSGESTETFVQNLKNFADLSAQEGYENRLEAQEHTLSAQGASAATIQEVRQADAAELNIAEAYIAADSKSLASELSGNSNERILSSYGVGNFLSAVASQVEGSQVFVAQESKIQAIAPTTSSILDDMTGSAKQMLRHSETYNELDAMTRSVTLSVCAADPTFAAENNVHLGQNGGYSQAELQVIAQNPQLMKDLGINSVTFQNASYGALTPFEDIGNWMKDHQGASIGIGIALAVVTAGTLGAAEGALEAIGLGASKAPEEDDDTPGSAPAEATGGSTGRVAPADVPAGTGGTEGVTYRGDFDERAAGVETEIATAVSSKESLIQQGDFPEGWHEITPDDYDYGVAREIPLSPEAIDAYVRGSSLSNSGDKVNLWKLDLNPDPNLTPNDMNASSEKFNDGLVDIPLSKDE